MKLVLLLGLLLSSFSAFSQSCATSIEGLKTLVGNSDLALTWKEKSDDRPITFVASDSASGLKFTLTNSQGLLGSVFLKVCGSGSTYKGVVKKIVWGPAAPGIFRGKSINSFKIKFNYQTELRTSRFLMGMTFEAR